MIADVPGMLCPTVKGAINLPFDPQDGISCLKLRWICPQFSIDLCISLTETRALSYRYMDRRTNKDSRGMSASKGGLISGNWYKSDFLEVYPENGESTAVTGLGMSVDTASIDAVHTPKTLPRADWCILTQAPPPY